DLKLPFFIRNKKEGDFINMSYGNKKVSRILIDEKIPVSKRNQIPLVFDNEGNLLWVYNLAKSQAVQSQKDKSDIYLVCEEVHYEE
ncbi:MAG: tRNA lysidine(34) synthetase TilS, partial [Anaeroplasmataceae bacterium]|nr:tRNA lysidine(34) synthetase TilS [Anaeroplasmataceae bacterium]